MRRILFCLVFAVVFSTLPVYADQSHDLLPPQYAEAVNNWFTINGMRSSISSFHIEGHVTHLSGNVKMHCEGGYHNKAVASTQFVVTTEQEVPSFVTATMDSLHLSGAGPEEVVAFLSAFDRDNPNRARVQQWVTAKLWRLASMLCFMPDDHIEYMAISIWLRPDWLDARVVPTYITREQFRALISDD